MFLTLSTNCKKTRPNATYTDQKKQGNVWLKHSWFKSNGWKTLCYMCLFAAPLFSTLMFAEFPNQSPLLTMVKGTKDRSLFISRGKTKGGINRNWEPKRGDNWKLWRDSEGGPLKFAWKMKTWGGGDRESHQMLLGGSLQWSNIHRVIG